MKKILVIEDEPILRNNLLKILEVGGFEAIEAEDGASGVQLALEQKPNLIISDIMMPEMDGFAVLTQLQQNPETALIPFIFLTAVADRSSIRRGIECGADDYITKPFGADELLAAVKARFKKQEQLYERFNSLSFELTQAKQLMEAKDDMVENLTQELRRPLSNLKLAAEMLGKEEAQAARDRYLQVLQKEFAREIALLNQVSELKSLLTPENVNLLSKFNMLKPKES